MARPILPLWISEMLPIYFADPDFDGDPVMIKDVGEDEDLSGTEEETTEAPIIDVDGEEVDFPEPPEYPEITGGGGILEEPRVKIRVDGVQVRIVNERVQYLGSDGKIITEIIKRLH